MVKRNGIVIEYIVTVVIMVLVFYFVRVVDNVSLALVSFIFGIVGILGLRRIMRRSGVTVYQNRFRGWGVNTLRPEFRVAMMLFSGLVFAGVMVGAVRFFVGWLPIDAHVSLIILCGVVGALIGDVIRGSIVKRQQK